MNVTGASRRTLCRALVAAALPTLLPAIDLRLAAAKAEESSMPRPLVPLCTTVDQWDHHWFLWLPHHRTYEAVEVASRGPDPDGRAAVWVWFTERTGKKRQVHYRNDPQLAKFVEGNYCPIDYAISGDDGRPRGLKVRFEDIEGKPVEIDVAFDEGQTLSRNGAGLTDQSGHLGERAFLIFYRDVNALAQDARVSMAGENVTFDRNERVGEFRFKWAYSHHIIIGLILFGSFKVSFGPAGFLPLEAGGYAQQRLRGGSITLLTDSDGQLREYVDRGATGGLLRIAFDPPLPACRGTSEHASSAFSISIGAAADVIRGRVETRCGADANALAWQPSEPMWASRQPFRSEIARADEHSLLIAVAPAS